MPTLIPQSEPCRRLRVPQVLRTWGMPLAALLAFSCVGLALAAGDDGTASVSAAAELKAPEAYGAWVLAPALAAITCAVITRQVIPSLLLGTAVAACMVLPCLPPEASFGQSNPVIRVVRLTVETYLIGAIINPEHIKVILFTLIIGGMVGVMEANGGTRALVDVIARKASNRRRGQLTAWLAGLVVFFDDYANTMIVGPTMQPICDRLRISRAKLAYIVDSTAAPVASIALVGTWVGAEIGYIQEGIDKVYATGHVPEFLEGLDGWRAFVSSIPYRFYPILAIVFVLLVAVTGRDIGPMRRSEAQARDGAAQAPPTDRAPSARASGWWLAALPIAMLVLGTFGVLLWPGLFDRPPGVPLTVTAIFDAADPYVSILYGAVLGIVAAIGSTVLSRRGALKFSMDGAMAGLARMVPAVSVLVLAWALSDSSQKLHVGEVVSNWLEGCGFSITWLPLAVFVSAAGVSFATGTSWGTMGILCPMVVTVAAGLAESLPVEEARPLFYASVGSVLAGAIFGDHCSPISDTTVLSSLASNCTLEEHVWTQLPYAVIAALVGMAAGDAMCNKLGQSPWLGLALGTIVLILILRVFGRRIEPGGVRSADRRSASP